MSWAPFLLALVFGVLISATLHFVLVWPAREPAQDPAQDPDDPAAEPAGQRALDA